MMMYDQLYAIWLSSTHNYFLWFQWGYEELLPLYGDYNINVDFYFNYYFKLF